MQQEQQLHLLLAGTLKSFLAGMVFAAHHRSWCCLLLALAISSVAARCTGGYAHAQMATSSEQLPSLIFSTLAHCAASAD
jgi:hypothetical protein